MRIKTIVTGIISTNCYVVHNEETQEAVIIDPGACSKNLKDYLLEKKLTVKGILLTHGHFDHILGLDGLLEMFDVPVYVHRDEEKLITDPILNQSKAYTNGYTFTKAKYVEDKEVLHLIGYSFQVIHTPGHTKGGACYYVKEEDVLFSGDTLFYASVGRTDFPTGSTSELIRSIREKLMCLPDDTIVYPGHMGATSIGYEREQNPFIQ